VSLFGHQPEWAWFNQGGDPIPYRVAKANTACLDRGGNPIPTRAVEHSDAIGVDLPKPGAFEVMAQAAQVVSKSISEMVEAWTATASRAGDFLQAVIRTRHLQWHRLVGAMTDNPKIRRRYRQCRICNPYSNPAPLPRGRGTAYARRRRHR